MHNPGTHFNRRPATPAMVRNGQYTTERTDFGTGIIGKSLGLYQRVLTSRHIWATAKTTANPITRGSSVATVVHFALPVSL